MELEKKRKQNERLSIKHGDRKMKKILLFTLTIIALLNTNAQTPPTIYVAGDGTGDFNCYGDTAQVAINQALDFAATNSDYTTVYLKGPHTYIINNTIVISSNTILRGDTTAVIKLKDNAGWWTQDKPMLAQTGRVGWDPYGDPSESISNVEIHGFTIDGGMFQEEPSGARYNGLIHFTFPYNIKIHDMHFKNGGQDAVRLSALGTSHINCKVYNNLIDENGHDAISFVGVINFEAYGNEIYKTRTNSGIRTTDCDTLISIIIL